MADASTSAVFLDTSIQIARFVHGPNAKQRIRDCLSRFRFVATGLVVRQEFKRRLLREAKYLLEQLNQRGSFAQVHRHVVDRLTSFHARKRNICLEVLSSVFDDEDDASLTDRLRCLLESLLENGLEDFDASVGHVVKASRCALGRTTVRQKGESYDFGQTRCSQTGEACGVANFLSERREVAERIYDSLERLIAKTAELVSIQQFLQDCLKDTSLASSCEACTTVGDLLISIESADVPTFYTMNHAESRHLAKALGQELIVRPHNDEKPDVVCAVGADWSQLLD